MARKPIAYALAIAAAALPSQAIADPGNTLHDIADGLTQPYFLVGAGLFSLAMAFMALRRRVRNRQVK